MKKKVTSDDTKIQINRAPVLTLWTAVVAKTIGHPWDTSLTLGKAVAGQFAFSKGKSIGLMSPSEKTQEERKKARGEHFWIPILNTKIASRETSDGIRALDKGKATNPRAVEGYVKSKFGGEENLKEAIDAMEYLCNSFTNQEELEKSAYHLYERFRPSVPQGARGWGRKGLLDLSFIRSLAHREDWLEDS